MTCTNKTTPKTNIHSLSPLNYGDNTVSMYMCLNSSVSYNMNYNTYSIYITILSQIERKLISNRFSIRLK